MSVVKAQKMEVEKGWGVEVSVAKAQKVEVENG